MSIHQIVVFLGAPGSGKGALSHYCVANFGWKQLSTGNLCRKHRAEGTELGRQIDFALKSGTLVSDEVIIDIVTDWIGQEIENAQGIILDGFPRTVVQAKGFLEFLKNKSLHNKLVLVELQVPDQEIIERLSSRLVCTNKTCQAVFSNRTDALKPRQEGVCDYCGFDLAQRDDDKQEVIASRLITYHQHRDDLVHFYENAGHNVCTLDGNKDNAEVFKNFTSYVNAL